jgi:hypothetical protein
MILKVVSARREETLVSLRNQARRGRDACSPDGKIHDDVDTEGSERRSRSNSGELKDLRGTDGSTTARESREQRQLRNRQKERTRRARERTRG